MPLIPIVDTDDNIIEYKERWSLDPRDIYRVSALWITNAHGEILIAQRHRSKKNHPLLWWPAVCGTVEKGEIYLENIIKETEEEIGISWYSPSLWPKIRNLSWYLYFVQWFTLTLDLSQEMFLLQENEVEKVRWITPEALKNEFTLYPENSPSTFPKEFNLFHS